MPDFNTAPAPAPIDTALAPRLDAAIGRALFEERIVGTVVMVARHGRLLYSRAAGLADREAATPMREDLIFLLSSLTKPIVCAAALRLVEQGRLGLDQPVTQFLPAFAPRLADGETPVITIRHLLTHTAGLSYQFMEQDPEGPYHRLAISNGLDAAGPSLEETLTRIASVPLSYRPGGGWGYSMAIDVLGAVIEKVEGDLPWAVERLVTQPLGLRDTAFRVTDRQRLVTAYGSGDTRPERIEEGQTLYYMGGGVGFSPSRLFDTRAFPSGGAGMAGTGGEFMAFLEALRMGRLVSPETFAQMHTAQVGAEAQTEGPGWGFGFGGAVLVDPALAGSPQSPGTLTWNGAYGHHWFIDPAQGLSVLALTNTTFEGMAGPFTSEVRNAVYGRAG